MVEAQVDYVRFKLLLDKYPSYLLLKKQWEIMYKIAMAKMLKIIKDESKRSKTTNKKEDKGTTNTTNSRTNNGRD